MSSSSPPPGHDDDDNGGEEADLVELAPSHHNNLLDVLQEHHILPMSNPATQESINAAASQLPVGQDDMALQEFAMQQLNSIREAASLFSKYNRCLRLIENSASDGFDLFDELAETVGELSENQRVSNKMKLRGMLINRDNVRTFKILQDTFQLDMNTSLYMGKMSLLQIACDSGR